MAAAKTAARTRAAAAGDQDALARLLARKPAEKSVWLLVDADLQEAFETVQSETFAARIGNDEVAKRAAKKKVDEAQAALERGGAVRVLLRSKGRRAYEELLRRHPPRDEDHEAVRAQTGEPSARADCNPRTFPFALIELATAAPEGLTADLLNEMVDDGRISQGEMQQLFDAARQVHLGSQVLSLGK